MWEEPCLSGEKGCGTVFFSGCSLRCCFCQNYEISSLDKGMDISTDRLSEIFLELQAQGAHNISLVTGTHFAPYIIEALENVKGRLNIPVVWNSSGYEEISTLNMLAPYVDIWQPDVKFYDTELSKRLCGAEDYFEKAIAAVEECVRLAGKPVFDENGLMKSGVIVRHLILPSHYKDSLKIIEALRPYKDDIILSLMSQYTPFYKALEHKDISRRLSTYEYEKVLSAAEDFSGYSQERSSAKEEYTPEFDLYGL